MSARRRRPRLDPVTLSVIANRVDAIVREMSNALLKSARSTVIASARDFSCTVVTGDNRLLSATDGIPVHVFGSDLQTRSMVALHRDLAEGDAYLHNDPYLGNTHAGDQTILVPVFFGGRHVFTACAKAHQADIGNSIPSTYHAAARDVYEEGALVFPCTRIERGYRPIADVIRFCRARIRVPDQWYGDFLATLGSARTGERRLKELCAKYGLATILVFIEEWLDYSERRMAQAIRRLPKTRVSATIAHDPVPPLVPDPIPIKVTVAIDPDKAAIDVDLRDNIDNLPCGLNQSEACVRNNTLIGVLNGLDPDLPRNAGSFRRVNIRIREGSAVGKPKFPASCSLATTNIADRLINVIQSAFAALGEGYGLAHGGTGMSAVVSGKDYRYGGAPFINQLSLNVNGGPGGPRADGWVTYGIPAGGGMIYRESIELVEVKHPILVDHQRLRPASAGAGRRRGSPGGEVVYGPRRDPMTLSIASDSQVFPAQGVRGGRAGAPSANYRIGANGFEEKLPAIVVFELKPGERVRFENAAGGGYGDPRRREPERVLADVRRGWETVERARAIYGVVLTGSAADETLSVDAAATAALRAA
jgi:N-methylhydantoinase B